MHGEAGGEDGDVHALTAQLLQHEHDLAVGLV